MWKNKNKIPINKKQVNLLINNDVKKAPIVFNWRLLACCDLYGTNFYKFYGRFEEIGLLYI